ncbi:hypothetical protein S58_34780 [Bradyrhizobium oligotrophicum S58]|uniref:Uncharacterized protein n=2 Tax=Bradyrhizobium TaxID=374 RepID=M4Z8G1_9BRAD|nr:hypothetical protein [Bradyrhizobium oligotrophicum]BAM89471.1 hypothetical protein S58_34780 [Bradyrhizobium oligotrophicum S58]
MAASIILFAGATNALTIAGLTPNDPFTVEEILVTTPQGSGRIKINPVVIPSHASTAANHPRESILIADADVTLNPWNLKSWSGIQQDIKKLRDDAAFALAAVAEAERDALRSALANVSIDLAAAGFFGISGLPVAGGGKFEAHLKIDLTAFNPGHDDTALLTATFAGSGQITVSTLAGGANADAEFGFEVTLTRDELVNLLPSISLHPLPRFPALHLRWPKIPWPHLDWPSLDLSELLNLFRFDLPIPKINLGKSPIWVRWTTAPKLKLAINATKQLEITTAAAERGDGTLVCEIDPAGGHPTDIASINGFGITLDAAGKLTLAGTIAPAGSPGIDLPATVIEKPDALPFKIELAASRLDIQIPPVDLEHPTAVGVTATLKLPRVLIRAKNDPALLIAFHAEYAQTFDTPTGATSGQLTVLEIVEPYPVKLVALAAQEAADLAQALIRFLSALHVQGPDVPDLSNVFKVLDRVADMMAAAVRWLAQQVGAAAHALLGVAEAVGEVLAKLTRMLCDAIKSLGSSGPGIALVVEVRLDARTYALRQIVISPAWVSPPGQHFTGQELGLSLDIPLDWQPMLVIDLDGTPNVALLAAPPMNSPAILGTDLWLSRDAGVEAVRDTDGDGNRLVDKRLIQITAHLKTDKTAIALIRLSGGKVQFMQACKAAIQQTPVTLPAGTSLPAGLQVTRISGALTYGPLDWTNTVTATIEAQTKRLLPFLQSTNQSTPRFFDTLGQYIQINDKTPTAPTDKGNGQFELPLSVTLKLKDTSADFDLNVNVDVTNFSVRLSGGDKVRIFGGDTEDKTRFDLLGLTGKIVLIAPRDIHWPTGKFPFFGLDFSHGDVRLSLAPEVRLDLSYGQVASGGRGIVFHVDELGMSRSGLDLSAKVDRDTPVQLAGVDMPFRFDGGGLSIKNSEIQAFSIKGSGQLPPELVGEANATISISMGRGSDGSLIVQSAEAKLDKANDPIVCHATRFVLTITALGLEFQNFTGEGAGYHFYFTLTGTAVFQPREGEFADGLLKYLGSITITLDKAPLARDASMLLRAISFQVAVVPAKRFNFFNLFNFELRGIGFHPASPAFGGKPALSISGQVNFVEAGDVVSPRIDFHELWIAPPKAGQSLPQIRFDGLTLGIRFGGAASIEGTAMTVDDTLPSLYSPGALPKDVTVHGFLASGKLTIKGWGAMSASMGFLELRKPGGDLRQAFFLYGEADDLSIEIPTPVGPIYLREVGFGFGYRFTLAAFNRADQVTNVKDLIKVLDDISKYQGNLASVRSWEPEAEGNRVTLALRGLITIESASGESEYNADGEKELPNPILFDIVAALRSDFTFFLNARVWIARNYADWHDSSANDSWRNNPTLRGYVYLSVPRKEFLGRLIADGTGDVDGTHPKLPAPLVKAMKGIRWSATTYIRPGLFHQEFGWPYELGFTFEEKQGGGAFQIVCQGGLINRIEDGAMLYGIAFRANGYAQFGGQVGGRSFGASVVARADFSISAKFIAYISVKRFSDTLFYGSIAFDISLSLQVRIWLEFSVGFTDIHLEVGFSVSLTISIALEAAATPNSIAARGSASVGVGAFGRHIRLGIAFAVNPGRLDEARARVERFMQLGLTVAMPDAEKGLAPPAPELPRGPRAGDADQAVDNALDKHEAVTAPLPGALPIAQGRDLQPTAYWAMLFPVAGDHDQFVMVFVPRDHTETGLDNSVLPTVGTDGQLLGSFYPPPYGKRTDATGAVVDGPNANALQIALESGPGFSIDRFKWTGGTETVTVNATAPLPLQYNFDAVVARTADKKDSIKLDNFLSQCFVVRDKPQKSTSLGEPWAKRISAAPERLPDTREAAAQVLTEAGRDQLALGLEERAANDIEERRSAAVASLCDSAANLAASPAAWNQPATEGIDARSFGVAFRIDRTEIDALFPLKDDNPRKATFKLQAVDSTITPLDGNVHLFNPPERMFSERGPRLADPVIEATPNGIRLDWDLEPAFGPSAGVWHDPEFNLKHYRIERIVTTANSLDSRYKPLRITTKAAGPMRLVRDPVTANFVWRFVRPNAQFVDDLSDLPAELRRLLLPPSNIPANAPAGPPANLPDPPPSMLRYVVVPVDTAGTDGPPTPLVLQTTKAEPARKGVARAVLHFEYRGSQEKVVADVTTTTSLMPAFTLGIDDGGDLPAADPKKRKDLKSPRVYVVRVRKELAIPIGHYGSDAVSDARARPSAADFATKRPTDRDFVITLTDGLLPTAPGTPAEKVQEPSFDDPSAVVAATSPATPGYMINDLDGFRAAIGARRTPQDRLDNGPIGVRFAIQPQLNPTVNGDEPPWCPMDTTILIALTDVVTPDNSADNLPAVAAPVEVFEHPVKIDSAPLLAEDLDGEAGRVTILHPQKDATLAQLVGWRDGSTGTPPVVRLRDAARRVGTKVRWNARPAASETPATDRSAKRNALYFAGYDLFELDVAGEAEGATSAPTALTMHYLFSSSNVDANPGNALRVHVADGMMDAILVGGDQVANLDSLDDSGDAAKGQIRVIQVDNPANALTFDLKLCVRARGYRKLVVEPVPGKPPFADGKALALIFTRDPPASHLARVQALPASLARLDPAEIIDFAKIEAHYPSETSRLLASTATRQGAWYSPAESFLVWPERILRRSLALNVDEPVLTELLSNGRPERIAVALKITGAFDKADHLDGEIRRVLRTGSEETQNSNGFKPADAAGWTAASLRELFQSLVWNSNKPEIRAGYDKLPLPFRNARLTVSALKSGAPDVVLGSADWQIDLDPAMHPVLADVIDRARYATLPDRILRYPQLVLDAAARQAIETWLSNPANTIGASVWFDLRDWTAPVSKPALGFQLDGDFRFASVESPAEFRIEPPREKTTVSRTDVIKQIMGAIQRLTLQLDGKQVAAIGALSPANLVVKLGTAPGAPASTPQPFTVAAQTRPGPRYRRYEPVLEQSPKINAKEIAGWFDETPVQRDPYGWSILRSLGLAAGLKLYDTEARDYLPPAETLETLLGAFAEILPRYPIAGIGAPFVDIITHAGGTMSLASFDGSMSGVAADEVEALRSDKALSLVQIAMRPTVDRFARVWTDHGDERPGSFEPIEKVVAYFAVKPTDPTGAPKITIDLNGLNPAPGLVAIAEVIDLSSGLAKPPVVTLVSKAGTGNAELRTAMLDGVGEQQTLDIDASRLAPKAVAAIVRVTVNAGDAAQIFSQPAGSTWVTGATIEEISSPDGPEVQPFGRFPDMTARRYGALAAAGGHQSLIDAIERFRIYAVRRLPDGWPNATDVPTLVARIPEWTRRFFNHGPAAQPDRSAMPLFAIAEVTRPDPWRVGVAGDGTMEVLFTHDDRKRRLKRYAVRPFGRYEAFADALTHASDPDVPPQPPRLGGAWSDILADGADVQRKFEENWSQRFFDVVLPRTEPLAPPVLIEARRVEILPPATATDPAPRKVLELLYTRHPEEVLSEANVTVEGALSFETVSYGFWREFPMQCWANDLGSGSTTEKFGDWDRRPAPFQLIESDDEFGGLAQVPAPDGKSGLVPGRFTDGWRGALALRTEAIPYFFRTHVAAFASAGVVVSEPVIATIEEGHYELALPWKPGATAKPDDIFVSTPPPVWSVARHCSGPNPEIWVTFDLPLARLFDSMPQDSRKIWLQGNIPDVFMLPDPVARHEIGVVATDDAGLSAASAEIDIIGQQRTVTRPEPGKPVTASGYRMNLVGPLFSPSSSVLLSPARQSGSGTWWKLSPSVLVKPNATLPSDKFAPSIAAKDPTSGGTDPLRGFLLAPEEFGAAGIWPVVAPTTTLTFEVHVPTVNTGWPAFVAAVAAWRAVYLDYRAVAGAKAIWEFLDLWANTSWPPPATQPKKLTTAEFAAGLPWPPSTLPPDVSMSESGGWNWPTLTGGGVAQRQRVRAIVPKTGYSAKDFRTKIGEPICAEMRRVVTACDELKNPFANYAPLNTVLPADPPVLPPSGSIAKAAYRLATTKTLPECLDVVAAIPITVDRTAANIATKINDLIAAIEALRFTSTAIFDLGALEDEVADAVEMHLPCHALADASIVAKLADVDAGALGRLRVWSLLLRQPPDDGERKQMMDAIGQLAPDPQEDKAGLVKFVDRSLADQIFGSGRSPRIKVYRGTSVPQLDPIQRAGA